MPQGEAPEPSEFIAFTAKVKHKTTSLSYVDFVVVGCMARIFLFCDRRELRLNQNNVFACSFWKVNEYT